MVRGKSDQLHYLTSRILSGLVGDAMLGIIKDQNFIAHCDNIIAICT